MILPADLEVVNLVWNRHLAKSISDAGWAAFGPTLEYTAACAGKQVVLVDPAYTSQDCCGGGVFVAERLSVRRHVCPCCGPGSPVVEWWDHPLC